MASSTALHAQVKTAFLEFDTEMHPDMAKDLNVSMRNAIVGAADRTLVSNTGFTGEDAQATFACVELSATCMQSVADTLKAERLIWGLIERRPSGWSVSLSELERRSRRIAYDRQYELPDDALRPDVIRKVARTFLARQRFEVNLSVQLDIDSEPSGAQVLVDGNEMGETPMILPLVQGTHLLETRLQGYETDRRKIDLDRPMMRLMVPLVRNTVLADASSTAVSGDRPFWLRRNFYWVTALTGGATWIVLGSSVLLLEHTNEQNIADMNLDNDEATNERRKLLPWFTVAKGTINYVVAPVTLMSAAAWAYLYFGDDTAAPKQTSVGVSTNGMFIQGQF